MTGLTRARLLGLAALAALCLALAMPASGLGAATPTLIPILPVRVS